jgi:hypothetical protein
MFFVQRKEPKTSMLALPDYTLEIIKLILLLKQSQNGKKFDRYMI